MHKKHGMWIAHCTFELSVPYNGLKQFKNVSANSVEIYAFFQNNLSFTFFSDKQFVLYNKSIEQLVLTSYCRNGSLFVLANHDAKAQLPSELLRSCSERQKPRAVYDTSLHLINKDLGMQKEKFSVVQQEWQHHLSHLKVWNIFLPPQKPRNDISVGHTTDAQWKFSFD